MKISDEGQLTFDVFMSYASIDRDLVEKLVKRLEEDGFRVWYDQKQISRGQITIGQLADGIFSSSHMIVCLSDAYIDRDFTQFELNLNQSFDPANKRNRTIPVVIKPLTRPILNQIKAINLGDLTNPTKYDEEYQRIIKDISHTHPAEEGGKLNVNIEGIRKKFDLPFKNPVEEPFVILIQARIAVESLCRFICRQEFGSIPENPTFDSLVDQVLGIRKLPQNVKMALGTVKDYGNYVDQDYEEESPISLDSIEPALASLKILNRWLLDNYGKKKQPEPIAPDIDEEEKAPSPVVPVQVEKQPEIPPSEEQTRVVKKQPPAPREAFQKIVEFELEARDAWYLGNEKLLVLERGTNTLEIWDPAQRLWYDSRPIQFRRARRGDDNQLAIAGWDGMVHLFQGDRFSATASLNGAIGDIQFSSGRWVVGTWRINLAFIQPDTGQVEQLSQIDNGARQIAVMPQGQWFAVADFTGGISIFRAGKKVAAVAPLENLNSMIFIGQHISAIDANKLVTIDLKGEITAIESVGNEKKVELLPSPAPNTGFLAIEGRDFWLLNAAGVRIPYCNLNEEHQLISTCKNLEKVAFSSATGGCEYWQERKLKQSWPDALSAELSSDGHFLTVVCADKVTAYAEKV